MDVAAVEGAEWGTAVLRSRSGGVLDLSSDRWIADADVTDERLLAHAVGPVLDIGCGPGRHVAALGRRNIEVLGIDVSAPAVAHAQERERPVVQCSVFDVIPNAGQWATVLLLDGNIGIGGDPVALLQRAVSLLRASGRILIEVAPTDGRPVLDSVRLELDGVAGPWFPWAHVDADYLRDAAATCGVDITDEWRMDDRHFMMLTQLRSLH